MNEILWGRLIAFIVSAFLLSLTIVPLVKRLAWQYQWFDRPDHRKIHKYPTPRVGGIAIFVSFLFITITVLLRDSGLHAIEFNRFIILLTGSGIIFLLGVFDDLRGMNACRKFAVQVVAGILAYLAGPL